LQTFLWHQIVLMTSIVLIQYSTKVNHTIVVVGIRQCIVIFSPYDNILSSLRSRHEEYKRRGRIERRKKKVNKYACARSVNSNSYIFIPLRKVNHIQHHQKMNEFCFSSANTTPSQVRNYHLYNISILTWHWHYF